MWHHRKVLCCYVLLPLKSFWTPAYGMGSRFLSQILLTAGLGLDQGAWGAGFKEIPAVRVPPLRKPSTSLLLESAIWQVPTSTNDHKSTMHVDLGVNKVYWVSGFTNAESVTIRAGLASDIVSYKLALAMGTCQLPLQGLSHVLLQLLTFNTPERSSRWREEMRHSVLEWGENGEDRSSDT